MNENLIEHLKKRGLIFQITNENIFSTKTTLYAGADLTADSLHVGHLILLRTLEIISNFGHNVIFLLGSGTSRIGDPSFKTKERSVLSVEEIEKNKKGIQITVDKLIGQKCKIVDNIDWLEGMKYLDVLDKYSRYFSINRMIKTDFIKNRLEKNLPFSLLELSYSVIQAIDFVFLRENLSCTVQIGGSDQWANIISGIDLGHSLGYKDMNGFTIPLLTTKSGVKMGKTEGGAIWLRKEYTNVYDFWQYFRSIDDKLVRPLLKIFLDDLSVADKQADINDAKTLLADTILKYVHGEEELEKVKNTLSVFYNKEETNLGLVPEDLRLKISNITETISAEELVLISQIGDSKTNARKLLESGQIFINNEKATYKQVFQSKKGVLYKVSHGKNIHKIVEFL